MIDVHSHIIPGIDDGIQTIDHSIKLIKDMYSFGYTSIILTPHYIKDSNYDSDRKNNTKIVDKLTTRLREENIDMKLYLGNEIFIDDDILELLEKNIISPLADSKYLLIEIPMSGNHNHYKDIFVELMNHGYKIILAHPERYHTFEQDFSKIQELYDMGILLQGNIESIVGSYGKQAKKTFKRLVKNKMLTFLGTDIHKVKSDYQIWNKARHRIIRLTDIEYFSDLTENNPRKILERK